MAHKKWSDFAFTYKPTDNRVQVCSCREAAERSQISGTFGASNGYVWITAHDALIHYLQYPVPEQRNDRWEAWDCWGDFKEFAHEYEKKWDNYFWAWDSSWLRGVSPHIRVYDSKKNRDAATRLDDEQSKATAKEARDFYLRHGEWPMGVDSDDFIKELELQKNFKGKKQEQATVATSTMPDGWRNFYYGTHDNSTLHVFDSARSLLRFAEGHNMFGLGFGMRIPQDFGVRGFSQVTDSGAWEFFTLHRRLDCCRFNDDSVRQKFKEMIDAHESKQEQMAKVEKVVIEAVTKAAKDKKEKPVKEAAEKIDTLMAESQRLDLVVIQQRDDLLYEWKRAHDVLSALQGCINYVTDSVTARPDLDAMMKSLKRYLKQWDGKRHELFLEYKKAEKAAEIGILEYALKSKKGDEICAS